MGSTKVTNWTDDGSGKYFYYEGRCHLLMHNVGQPVQLPQFSADRCTPTTHPTTLIGRDPIVTWLEQFLRPALANPEKTGVEVRRLFVDGAKYYDPTNALFPNSEERYVEAVWGDRKVQAEFGCYIAVSAKATEPDTWFHDSRFFALMRTSDGRDVFVIGEFDKANLTNIELSRMSTRQTLSKFKLKSLRVYPNILTPKNEMGSPFYNDPVENWFNNNFVRERPTDPGCGETPGRRYKSSLLNLDAVGLAVIDEAKSGEKLP